MKLIFKVEINSKEWDNETFDDSKFDKKTLKSMLFDEFYDTLTDIMNVNDFSDNIKYISSNKTDKTSIQHLKTERGNISYED